MSFNSWGQSDINIQIVIYSLLFIKKFFKKGVDFLSNRVYNYYAYKMEE